VSIRVAGGYLGGRILKTVPGRATRPTTGRVREAIFSILQHDLEGAAVLDIFAGSGALAIEAVSRGAESAVLIEKGHKAVGVIRQNLKTCDLDLRIIAADYLKGLEILTAEEKKFDLVFADPPYELIRPDRFCRFPEKYPLLKPGALLILEHAGNVIPETGNIITTRRFGDSAITIYRYD
jgi:16S rRNA (guanine(966)-N(2))-methyltransferase RsmD